MADSGGATVVCPGCGTRYRWRAAFAGKQLHCKCGVDFLAEPPPLDDTGASAEAVGEASPAAEPMRMSEYARAMGEKSAVQRALERGEDAAQPSRVRELYLPTILLPVGWFASVVLWQRVTETPTATAMVVAGALLLQVLLFVPAMVAAMVTVARWFELGLGTLGPVLFKCLALTVGPGATADALLTWMMAAADFDWWLLAAGYAYYLILMGLPAALVFELNVYEAATAVALIFVPRIAAVYLAALVFAEVFVLV